MYVYIYIHIFIHIHIHIFRESFPACWHSDNSLSRAIELLQVSQISQICLIFYWRLTKTIHGMFHQQTMESSFEFQAGLQPHKEHCHAIPLQNSLFFFSSSVLYLPSNIEIEVTSAFCTNTMLMFHCD